MELKAENVKNIRSLAVCKEFLRQAIEQNDQLKSDYEEACGRLQTANLIKDEQLVATRHQKYKRCKAIARWCFTKSSYHFVVGRSEGGKTGMTDYRISSLYSKWYKRWIKIAEQFKEVK